MLMLGRREGFPEAWRLRDNFFIVGRREGESIH